MFSALSLMRMFFWNTSALCGRGVVLVLEIVVRMVAAGFRPSSRSSGLLSSVKKRKRQPLGSGHIEHNWSKNIFQHDSPSSYHPQYHFSLFSQYTLSSSPMSFFLQLDLFVQQYRTSVLG